MHYYNFHIGDYISKTSHLSLMEDLAYRKLLDWIYLNEKPIPNDIDKITRLLCMNGCSTDVQQVLNEFFTLVEDGWINNRANREIDAYHSKIDQASRAGKASAAKRLNKSNGRSTDVQPTNNHKPRTKNQEPRTINQEPVTSNQLKVSMSSHSAPTTKGTLLPAEWVLPKAWGEWAAGERTDLTTDQIRKEGEKFRDHWHANANQKNGKKSDWLAAWRNWIRQAKPVNGSTFKTAAEIREENSKKAIAEFLGESTTGINIIEGEFNHA